MTAKEKAQSLLDKYCEIKNVAFISLKERVVLNIARQCAIIAIDEIIKANPHSNYEETYPVTHSMIDYWNDVKKELKFMNL
jgi:hypothetical protein